MKDFQQITIDVSRRYLKDRFSTLTPSLAQTLNGFLRSRSISKLATASELFDPASHGSNTLETLLQVEAFFKKSNAWKDASMARSQAHLSFEKGETRCRITNRRLDYYFFNQDRLDPELRSRIKKMVSYIDRVLGDFSPFLSSLPEMIRLTSGATSESSRADSSPQRKLRRRISCTPRARPYIEALARVYGYKVSIREVWTNRVAFVPKSWKTDRTIACEPVGNLPLQLAFDRYTKDRLRNFGIDLSSQLRNQELALKGSVSGNYATLDLEGASDSLSISAVAWLLPDRWWKYLSDIRAPLFKLEGKVHRYAKFSSMGNGATFALETLVFAAACAAYTHDFAVYGDDIIVPPEHVVGVVQLLKFFGFRLNHTKSHTTGNFRESCGVNAFAGHDITPFYLREWREILTDFHHNVNGLVSIAAPCGELMEYLRDLVRSRKDAIVIPQVESTTAGIFIDTNEAYSRRLIRTGSKKQQGYPLIRVVLPVRRSHRITDSRSLFLWHLDKVYKKSSRTSLPVRLWTSYPAALAAYGYEDTGDERSLEPSAVQKYVRKMVPFRPTTRNGRGPDGRANHRHLHWWSEMLFRT